MVSFFLRIFFSVGLLVYLFTKIDIEKTWGVVQSARIDYLIYAWFIFCAIYGVLIVRWFTFINAMNISIPPFQIIRYFFIGLFGNLFLPSSIGGDLIKTLGLCRYTDEKAKVVASVILDRLSGFAGIVVVAIVSFTIGFRMIDDISILISIIGLFGLSLMITVFLFHERMYAWACRIFNPFPKAKESLMRLHQNISLLRNRKLEGLKAVGLSCVCQIILAVTFYFTARSLNQNISLIYFLIFVPLICVASSLPSIGGLGVREAGAAYLFSKIGVDPGVAVSISLINFTFMVAVGLLGGLIYVCTLSSGRVQYSPSDAAL